MIASRYTVIWSPEIESSIADYWVRADSTERARLTMIIYLIDQGLSISPEIKGEPIEGDPHTRMWGISHIDPPARVAFQVSPDDRRVSVLYLTLFGRQ